MSLNIPSERQHAFNSAAYMIERKLLDMQMFIIAHKQSLRSVCIEYTNSFTGEEFTAIENSLNKMYDMLAEFIKEYGVPKMKTTVRNELMVKTNFLWEDLSGAVSLKGYGYIDDAIVNDYQYRVNLMIDKTNNLIDQLKKQL